MGLPAPCQQTGLIQRAGASVAANTGKDAQKRIYILAAFFLFWAVVICARLVQLQVFDYGELEQHALRQQQRTIEVAPRRGIIFDRSGHDLAMSIEIGRAHV